MSHKNDQLNQFLEEIQTDSYLGPNILYWDRTEARPAQTLPFPAGLQPSLQSRLEKMGISRLYTHQARAWVLAQAHQHQVIVTGTASGKTLCYNLPVIDRALESPSTRALYLFPTKALAHDQLSAVQELLRDLEPHSVTAAAYDGDTPENARKWIRENASIVITNPDMLHAGILPHHTLWGSFFSNLEFVIVDEVHTYRGVFGSHLANIFRRFKRICRHYGSDPVYIFTSATIANPSELASSLIESPVEINNQDGSPRGRRNFLIYNPPLINPDLGIRSSSIFETTRLAEKSIATGNQTIIFGRSRRTVEIILNYLQRVLPMQKERINGYRSGYLASDRRKIEQNLRSGFTRAVVATNALELGIDIGALQTAILTGYPGSISATTQQSGRVGRHTDDSAAILVATPDPLDQFFARKPEYLTGSSPEKALINPDHLLILMQHIRCAAFELPFNPGDGFGHISPELVQDFLAVLEQQGEVFESGGKYFWTKDEYPAGAVSLRCATTQQISLKVEGEKGLEKIGEVDVASAHWMVHPQAVYMHEGQTYLVQTLDLEGSTAILTPVKQDYYTEPRMQTQIRLIERTDQISAPLFLRGVGEIEVSRQVIGYREIKWDTHENLGIGEVQLPPYVFPTVGCWLGLTDTLVDTLRQSGLWNNDPNKYGPHWEKIRDQVRARDHYRCQVCGAQESEHPHHVHHKIPFRSFVNADQANQLENLITLCPACHRRAEAVVHIQSGLAGLSYSIGHLAPVHLLCDIHDIEVTFDLQSVLTNGLPTIIVYDAIPAGIGLSRNLFEIQDELLSDCFDLISQCECVDGCPSCVGPVAENGLGGKKETLSILSLLLGMSYP